MARRPRSGDVGSGGRERSGPQRNQSEIEPARRQAFPWFQEPLSVVSRPPRLSSRNLDAFLSWAACVPHSESHRVKDSLASVKVTASLQETLHRELLREPIEDLGRHLILLATIGELRHPAAAAPLESFIRRATSEPPAQESDGCQAPLGVLEARAVEMLAYLRTPEADAMCLRVVRDHPLSAVRSAAVDAYLWNRGDSEEALQDVQRHVRPAERHLLGMARWGRSMDVSEFEETVARYYRQHPDQMPPPPKRAPKRRPRLPSEREQHSSDRPVSKRRRD